MYECFQRYSLNRNLVKMKREDVLRKLRLNGFIYNYKEELYIVLRPVYFYRVTPQFFVKVGINDDFTFCSIDIVDKDECIFNEFYIRDFGYQNSPLIQEIEKRAASHLSHLSRNGLLFDKQ